MKILLADSNEARREALTAQLTKLDAAFSVIPLASEAFLLAEVERLRPDVVLVDMARPDRDMLGSLPAQSGTPPVVMFLDGEDPGFMKQAISAWVSSYHGQEVARDAAKLVMRLAVAVFQRNQPEALCGTVLFFASTFGDGEAPDNAARFWQALIAEAPPPDSRLYALACWLLAIPLTRNFAALAPSWKQG